VLRGRLQVAMFVNISPVQWNLQETLCSLKFAARCRKVQLGRAKRGTEAPSSDVVAALQARVAELEALLDKAHTSRAGAGAD
jgi:hypothetical protein